MTLDTEPNTILEGGPATGLPEHERVRFLDAEQHVLKLPRGNRYEHFRRSHRTVRHRASELRVFEWTGSTFVAE
ncbi:DUF5988 family protein [Kitasatospora sp. NPDC056327]|uniref:DUF5988 family protein n=1 Tax=Kitasatospora sp. NPDC056327 TaxID=3345785 RepID=UPI0035E10BC1